MSVHISSAVWSNRTLKGSTKLVLLKFADLCDDNGENAWPSVARVAAECGMSDRQVQRIIGVLLERGFLQVQAEENTTHPSRTYRVIPDPRQNVTPTPVKLSPPSDIPMSQMSPDPSVIRNPEILSLSTPLTPKQEQILHLLHEQVRVRVFGGRTAPDTLWCDDLVKRGMTESDIRAACDASVGKGQNYVRKVLERRIQDREAGNDPDAGGTGDRNTHADGVPRQAQRGGLGAVSPRRGQPNRGAGFDSSGLHAIGAEDDPSAAAENTAPPTPPVQLHRV